jgi:hypothetical protein
MRFGLLLLTFFLSISTLAQAPVETAANSSDATPSPTASKHSETVPDAPPPKIIDDRSACPSGNGKACGIPAGRSRSYFFGNSALSPHRSWTAAATSPGMLLALGLLTASTVADIETTQSCIRSATCKEANPLMGQSRAQQYSVAMSINALAFWATAEDKRLGRGILPYSILWGAIATHATLAAHNASFTSK